MSRTRILVTGAGGFIGHHLVRYLVQKGYWVRGADQKRPEYAATDAHDFQVADLRDPASCRAAVGGIDQVYHLAADMGGIGYISAQRATIARNNTLMNVGMLDAAVAGDVQRFLYSSSACVYPHHLQTSADVVALREDDAWPAQPEEGYGLEKLFAEKLCEYYRTDHGLETRVVRFHNVYGPLGTYAGGREKAPAAIARKVASVRDGDEIDVWGDGEQTRSFMYIDDCVEGIYRIMHSDYAGPLNLGTDEMVTVNDLVDLVAAVAGKRIGKQHDLSKPQGVRGRNSDNSRLREVLKWEPRISLKKGLQPTYRWIAKQVEEEARAAERRAVAAAD
ncbi:NAD-dependent epimerase/dehydratase family protein [Falsiroseomonas oryzae]|uniref:NAD-dependent epimerase/dehydratase family protein n=1 Tax=Falsiroseomonas oryzae TaxID=2766473 RepID=UPI0022EA974B|nr:NAD-dependent epimerase/dehydratase family protein [Roseomonas sp. MO-31]